MDDLDSESLNVDLSDRRVSGEGQNALNADGLSRIGPARRRWNVALIVMLAAIAGFVVWRVESVAGSDWSTTHALIKPGYNRHLQTISGTVLFGSTILAAPDVFTSYAKQSVWVTDVRAHDVPDGIRALPPIRINLCRGDAANGVLLVQFPGQRLNSIYPVVEKPAPTFAPSNAAFQAMKRPFPSCIFLLPYQWVMRFTATKPGLYVIHGIDITYKIGGRIVTENYPLIWYEERFVRTLHQ